ncbi:unnamed protein product [Cuscuta campestris]|uniref:Uncharacterized protein n=1 Tax=Cuscuta campestris TaxID=132261 RepID=A0A484KPA8_9ASTE|nr:unnamed protein product [Cuscuta campestris]
MATFEVDKVHRARIIENRAKCVYNNIPGAYVNKVNWVDEGVVSKKVGNQGDVPSCWIWNSVKGFEGVYQQSDPQQIPLEFSVQEGSKFYGVHYRLDDWRTLLDDETEILNALEKQPVIISVPYTSALVSYDGPNLFHEKELKVHTWDEFQSFLNDNHYKDKTLIVLLYSSAGLDHPQSIEEEFSHVGKAYEYDEDFVLLKIDLDTADFNAKLWFHIRASQGLFVFKPKPNGPREFIDARRCKVQARDLDFYHMTRWLGEEAGGFSSAYL